MAQTFVLNAGYVWAMCDNSAYYEVYSVLTMLCSMEGNKLLTIF